MMRQHALSIATRSYRNEIHDISLILATPVEAELEPLPEAEETVEGHVIASLLSRSSTFIPIVAARAPSVNDIPSWIYDQHEPLPDDANVLANDYLRLVGHVGLQNATLCGPRSEFDENVVYATLKLGRGLHIAPVRGVCPVFSMGYFYITLPG